MPLQHVFKIAGPGDEAAVLGMMCDYYAGDGYPFDPDAAREAFRALIYNPSLGICAMVVCNREITGYIVITLGISFEYRGRDAFIDEVFIRPEWRGQGLGSAAIEFAATWCASHGVKALHLEVERSKPAAYRLYERAGFRNNDRALMTKRLFL